MNQSVSEQMLEVSGFAIGRRRDTINSASDKMSGGFCAKAELTPAELGFIFENYPEAATIKIGSAGLHGGRHFSIHDLIGHSVSGMVFVVTDFEKFNKQISERLETDFLRTNPSSSSRIRASFTSFMHENKLHWSRCCRNNIVMHNRTIREKLREISSRTGKTHAEILTELLDAAVLRA